MAMTSQEKRDGSLEAERAVIGAMLIEPDIVRDVVGKVSAEDFLHPTNRLIFQAARALFRAGERHHHPGTYRPAVFGISGPVDGDHADGRQLD